MLERAEPLADDRQPERVRPEERLDPSTSGSPLLDAAGAVCTILSRNSENNEPNRPTSASSITAL
jgi:hypothetical protein